MGELGAGAGAGAAGAYGLGLGALAALPGLAMASPKLAGCGAYGVVPYDAVPYDAHGDATVEWPCNIFTYAFDPTTIDLDQIFEFVDRSAPARLGSSLGST
jgi:hypothetical protein